MNSQGHKWLTNSRMTHYQRLLCENPRVQLKTVWTLNPVSCVETGNPSDNCEEVIGETYSSSLDQTDVPLQDPELELFTVRSSFIHDRQHKVGYAITTTGETMKTGPGYKGGQHNGLS